MKMRSLLCALLLAGASTALADSFGLTNSIQYYMVSQSGYYDITAIGATGGTYNTNAGGSGAQASGRIYLTAGLTLQIVVGGHGETSSYQVGGGGGGGSFVYYNASTRWWSAEAEAAMSQLAAMPQCPSSGAPQSELMAARAA